jgi:S1-C subfamily serine protease
VAGTVRFVAVLAAALVGCAVAAAEAAPARAQKVQQTPLEREAEDVLAAVVRIKMTAIPNARSTTTLGASREGTGIVIDERGYIVTIGYIVIEADSIEISTQDGRTFSATLVGYDHASGLGLLRASVPLGIKPMPMGQAADLAQREPVMVLPAGGREAASLAYVVAKRKFAASWEYLLDTAIFTSPPTLQWAGAALVSREGKLVGVGSLFVRETVDGSQAPGNMFVPIDLLKPILADLIEKGRRSGPARPWLGLATEELHGHLLVTRVSPDGPADQAGIRTGDIVVGVGKDPVKNHEELYLKVWGLGAAGVDVPLKVLQGVDMRELKVRSIDRFQYFKEKPVY